MKKFLYVLLPTLFLCAIAGAGYLAGAYATSARVDKFIRFFELGETLAGALSMPQLTQEQRSNFHSAYSDPSVDPKSISWAVPNRLTPFVGTAPTPGQHQNAHINSWQMRSQKELESPKPGNVYRIFLTGGSTAYGSGAPSQDKTIGSILEALLNEGSTQERSSRYEVFTFANPAWSSTHERIGIENYLSELQPDLVISLSGNNDVFWADAGRNVLWFSTFADDYYHTLANDALRISGRKEIPALPHATPASQRISPDTVSYRLEKNIRLGAHSLEISKVNWIFFLQPTLSVTKKELSRRESEFLSPSRDYYRECYTAMASHLSRLDLKNFKFKDLSGIFDSYRTKDDIFLDQFHFGDKGNALIAQSIYSELAKIRKSNR